MTVAGRHLTVRSVADRFGVSQHVVLAWIAKGELRAVNVAATLHTRPSWRIAEDAVRDFEQSRSHQLIPTNKTPSRSKAKDAISFY
jgi:excisionase family DNA binding protein